MRTIFIVSSQVIFIILSRFILLAVLSTLVILYRLIIIISPKMRAYLLYIRFRLIRREVINTIVKKSYVGDWFLFYMLGQNVDSMIFKEVMHELARKLGHLGKDFSDELVMRGRFGGMSLRRGTGSYPSLMSTCSSPASSSALSEDPPAVWSDAPPRALSGESPP